MRGGGGPLDFAFQDVCNIGNSSLCPKPLMPKKVEVEWFYDNLQDFIELTPKKDVPFIIEDWNAKVGSQEIPRVTGKFGLGVANATGQGITEFCQENELVIANTLFQQHKRQLYTWTSLAGQYQNQIDYIICSRRLRSSTQAAKPRLGADCGSAGSWGLSGNLQSES